MIRSLRRGVEGAYLARVRASGHAPELVWVLGHMRSGSTLLTHVLASDRRSAITAGERNRAYASALELDRAVADAYAANLGVVLSARYVIDQINHDGFVPDERLLVHPRVRPILLVREPEGALSSMLELFERTRGWQLEQCLAAYVTRLDTLSRYASMLDARARWITYDELTRDTDRTLAGLSRWLGIPIMRRYPRRIFTGRRGDKSDRIRSGEILAPRSPARPIPPPHLAHARDAYDRCVRTIASAVRSVRRG